MTASAPSRSPVTLYAQSVVDCSVVAGRLVRLASARHLRDLEHGRERGLWFDEEAAQDAIDFFGFLQLAEGEHDGKPFILAPWEEFIVGSLFGWKSDDGYRRFRLAYIEIGKGNGKSPLAAGIGLYCLVADGEAGAEVYSAAVTKEQASISFRDAKLMAEASPALSRRLTIMERNIAFHKTNSFFRPVSSEHRGLDGKRVHCALIDEIHEHASSIVVDKMRAGTKGRSQALIIEITNSGYDRETVCFQHHEYSSQILAGVIDNDSWFVFVCGLDPCDSCRADGHSMPQEGCAECDDWRDEAVWPKANPNLDVSITRKYLREQVAEAMGMPAKQNIVKRLNFCIWTENVTKWLNPETWESGSEPPTRDLKGRRCFAGIYAAATMDASALVLWFPDDESGGDCAPFFWLPGDNVAERIRQDRVPYDVWVREGLVEATDGNVIDYEAIRAKLSDLGALYDIREVGVLRYNALQLETQLMADGFEVRQFSTSFMTMNAPTKELQRLLLEGKCRHGGNAVLRWMASNVAVRVGPDGAIRPDQERSQASIAGIVALIMAIGGALTTTEKPAKAPSVYETRGVRWL